MDHYLSQIDFSIHESVDVFATKRFVTGTSRVLEITELLDEERFPIHSTI